MNEELLKASKAALELLRGYIEEIGGCDHSVGICMCSDIRVLENLEQAIKNSENQTP